MASRFLKLRSTTKIPANGLLLNSKPLRNWNKLIRKNIRMWSITLEKPKWLHHKCKRRRNQSKSRLKKKRRKKKKCRLRRKHLKAKMNLQNRNRKNQWKWASENSKNKSKSKSRSNKFKNKKKHLLRWVLIPAHTIILPSKPTEIKNTGSHFQG